MPIVDRRETRYFYNELASRIPRRGVPPSEDVRSIRRFRHGVARRHAAGLAVGVKPSRACGEAFMAERAHALDVRRDECARFLQTAALDWLYRPPNGPMVRRLAREAVALMGGCEREGGDNVGSE